MSRCKSALRQCRSTIMHDLMEYEPVLEALYQADIIPERRYQQIKSTTVKFDVIALILDSVEVSGEKGFLLFCDALKEDFPWIRDSLLHAVATTVSHKEVGNIDSDEWYQSTPPEQELMKLCKHISTNDWEILALQLGLSLNDVERIKCSTMDYMRMQNMLVVWLRREGHTASRRILYDAMTECGMYHVCEHWKP